MPTPPTLVAIDTESATLSGPPHLLEVAGVRFRAGEEVDHFSRLICPEVPIEPGASDVHGIEEEHVRAAGATAEVLGAFAEWVGDDPMLAHDARADGFALGFEFARHRLRPPGGPLVDTVAIARRVFPELEDHRLASLAEHLGLETQGLHRALFDAALLWQVVEAAVAELGGWGATSLARLVELGGSRTIASCAPPRPNRRPSVVRALERASLDGEAVRLLYGGADAAPSLVPVRPRWVYRIQKRGYLEAECLASGLLKTYRIDRVQRVLSER